MRVRDIFIGAIGVHLPPASSASDAVRDGRYEAASLAETGLTGVLDAGSAPAPDLAVLAARQAIARYGRADARPDLLLHASIFLQGLQAWSPASYVLRCVGGGTAPAIDLSQGCNGMLAAMELASSYLHAHSDARQALLTTAENFTSPLIDRWQSGGPWLLLSDAASALVLTKRPGFARLLAVRSVGLPELEGMHRGSEPLFPPDATAGRPVDLGSRAVAFGLLGGGLVDATDLIRKTQHELVLRTLDEAEVELGEVRRVLYMNAARPLVEQWLTEPLGVALADTAWEFGRAIGHTGPSDQLIAFDHLLAAHQLEPGDTVLLVGTAAGMSLSAAVLRIVRTPAW